MKIVICNECKHIDDDVLETYREKIMAEAKKTVPAVLGSYCRTCWHVCQITITVMWTIHCAFPSDCVRFGSRNKSDCMCSVCEHKQKHNGIHISMPFLIIYTHSIRRTFWETHCYAYIRDANMCCILFILYYRNTNRRKLCKKKILRNGEKFPRICLYWRRCK